MEFKKDKPVVVAKPVDQPPTFYNIHVILKVSSAVNRPELADQLRNVVKDAITEAPEGVEVLVLTLDKLEADHTDPDLKMIAYSKNIYFYRKGDRLE